MAQVVGHTIQEQGINSACAEKVFRIDVGMSKGCGNGEPEVDFGKRKPIIPFAWFATQTVYIH